METPRWKIITPSQYSQCVGVSEPKAISRRITMAGFRDVKRLEDFVFGFNPSVKKNVVFELAMCRFVREKRDALLLGPPGTGKSDLVQGVGLAAIQAGFTVYYRSIFDVARDFLHDEAMDGHDRVLQKYLFEVVMRRHELRSTMMTSNRPLEEWGKLIGDVLAATAILDRFLHRAELLQITGRSYRLEKAGKSSKGTKAPTGSAAEEK